MVDNLPPPHEIAATNALDVVRLLRDNSIRHAQLLDQLLVCLQQTESLDQLTAGLQQTESPRRVWQPSVDSTTATKQLRTHKMRRIDQHIGSQDPLARLKGTWVGHLYLNHLKQITFVRWLVIWSWRTFYSFYSFYVNPIAAYFVANAAKRWRNLIKLVDYVKTRNILTIKVLDAVRVETPVPKVFPAKDQEYLSSPHDYYDFPPIYVTEISNAMVYGGTNLVFTNDAVICHDLYDFERDYTSEELHGRHLIDAKKKRMRLLRHHGAPEQIPVAAVFVDACAPNYAHWLTEVLPRIAAFCAEKQFESIPIIVNDGLHDNIMESLLLITGPEREIIMLPAGRAVQLDVLYLTSVAGYVPFERRNNKISGHSHGAFSPYAFGELRNQAALFAEKLPKQEWPEKIYLSRNSGVRKLTNAAELERLLVAKNYVIVEPEKLTFIEQAQLFSRAKVIIGSSGAAFANILFAPSNVKIFIIISKYQNTSYWYWQNITCASGKVLNYIFAELDGRDVGIHSDFKIDIEGVIQELGGEL